MMINMFVHAQTKNGFITDDTKQNKTLLRLGSENAARR